MPRAKGSATLLPSAAARSVAVDGFQLGNERPLIWIAGPCVIESPEHTLATARHLARIARKHRLSFVFKASYDKANRSSIASFRGPGLRKGLDILRRVKEEVG